MINIGYDFLKKDLNKIQRFKTQLLILIKIGFKKFKI